MRLELDTHLAQQALREALDTKEVQEARERLNRITDLSNVRLQRQEIKEADEKKKIVPLSAFLFFDEGPILFSVSHSILTWCGGMPAGSWTVYSVFAPDSGWGLCLLAW